MALNSSESCEAGSAHLGQSPTEGASKSSGNQWEARLSSAPKVNSGGISGLRATVGKQI